MFKVVVFLTRKQGLTHAQFRDHYEKNHLPLSRRMFPQIVEHRRNYISEGDVMFPEGEAPKWDCITEVWFEDRSGFDSMVTTVMDPELGAELRDDEVKFLDSGRTGMIIVDEDRSTGL